MGSEAQNVSADICAARLVSHCCSCLPSTASTHSYRDMGVLHAHTHTQRGYTQIHFSHSHFSFCFLATLLDHSLFCRTIHTDIYSKNTYILSPSILLSFFSSSTHSHCITVSCTSAVQSCKCSFLTIRKRFYKQVYFL